MKICGQRDPVVAKVNGSTRMTQGNTSKTKDWHHRCRPPSLLVQHCLWLKGRAIAMLITAWMATQVLEVMVCAHGPWNQAVPGTGI